MTTIIFVAIGILIAAAAAYFVVFYGGDAFNSGEVKAEAARLVSEGQQISYATDLFYRQEDRLPGQTADGQLDGALAIQELKDKKYIPIAPVGSKLVNVDGWKMEYGSDGMIYTKIGQVVGANATSDEKRAYNASLSICQQARKQLAFSDFQTVYKCDGSDYSDASWHGRGTLPDREPCCIR